MFINVFNPNRMFLKLIYQYLIFLRKRVIETVLFQENECSNALF